MLPDGAPPWARALFLELCQARREIETLRQALGGHVLTRKEAARLLGCSTKTLQRYEKKGLIEQASVKRPGVHYFLDDVEGLRRLFH